MSSPAVSAVTAPSGFRASGVAAGLKASGRPDLGLLVAAEAASAAGLFTTNAFPAAPVVLSRRHLVSGRARAVVVNSGQANAGTGPAGMDDAVATAALVAEAVGCDASEVLVCSTGVIGPRVKMDVLRDGLSGAVDALSGDGGGDFAAAILTTDQGAKQTVVEADGFVVGGCVKGAGMIAPDLATMLAFFTTDAEVDPQTLDAVLRRAVAPVFNNLTVDGCASTNDSVLALAGGASGQVAAPGSRTLVAVEEAFAESAGDLARQIALGAEGATKVIVAQADGALDAEHAAGVARAVAGSLLVKTAVFGADPNPGRFLQAVGAAGAPIDPAAVTIALAGHTVVEGGAVAAFDAAACRESLKEREVVIRIDLGLGDAEATCFGCDLGYEYVRINAEYST